MSCAEVPAKVSSCKIIIRSEDSKVHIWNAWKMCEDILKEDGYMKESSSGKNSTVVSKLAIEIYNRVVATIDEMTLGKKEEYVSSDEDMTDDFEMYECTYDNEEEGDVQKKKSIHKIQQENISLEYKKKIVAIAKAHPKWSLRTLQRNGAALLKKKEYLKNWEAEIAAKEPTLSKYETINNLTIKRFEEARRNSEPVTTMAIRRWALNFAHEVGCQKFIASKHWANKFKDRHRIRQNKTTRLLERVDG